MALKGSADVGFLLVNGLSILGDMTSIEDEQTAPVEETTSLGQSAQTYAAVGVSDYVISQEGYYNDATGRSNAALNNLGADRLLSYAPEGNTFGSKVVTSQLVQATYKRQITRGALTKASATYESRGVHDEGKILHALGAETADGDNEDDSLDNAASSSNGGAGVLQVTALTLGGYDDVLIKIVDSADDMSYAELIAFTAVTAIGAERKTVAGTVDRYTAVTWDFEGTGTGPSVTFAVGLAR